MAGKSYVFQRELGGFRGVGPSVPSAFWGHNSLAFERDCSSDPALVRRLACMAELPTQASSMSNVSWSEHGDFMASGGEDCRIVVWSAEHQRAVHTLDMGHTATINCVRFLPASNNEQIISCGSDRQVRLVSLRKYAVKPFCHHRGKVKTAAVLDQNIFMSGSEDGTVRQVDIRAPLTGGSQQDLASSGHDSINVIADQRQERTGCTKMKVGVNSIAVMPLNPHIFITGGSDALVRLYDRRMASSSRGSVSSRVRWVSCFVPTHLKGSLIAPRPFVSPSRSIGVSGVAFTGDGQEILASYTSEQIYLFSAREHARQPHAFSATVDSVPHRASGLHRTRARHATNGRARNAEAAAQAGNTGAVGAAGTAVAGEPRRATSAAPAAPAQQPSTSHRADAPAAAAAAAAPDVAGGIGGEQRPMFDPLRRFRPVLQRRGTAVAAAQPAPAGPRRSSSPAQSVGGVRQPRDEAAQLRPPAHGVPEERPDSGAPSAGPNGELHAGSVPPAAPDALHTTTGTAAAAEDAPGVPAAAEEFQVRDDESPQEAAREERSAEEGQGLRRAAAWRSGSRPASFTGSALPPMAHSVGQLANGAVARRTPSTTAAYAQARLSPDLQVATSPVRRSGPMLRSHLGTIADGANAAAGAGHAAPAPQDDHASPLRTARRSKRRLAAEDAADSQAPANKARRAAAGPSVDIAAGSHGAPLDPAGPSGAAEAPQPDDAPGSPAETAQEAPAAEEAGLAAHTDPAEQAALPDAGAHRVHALRRAGSTMAAEGHVFAVACSSAERPTASTGTSRPRREDGRDAELQSRLHNGLQAQAAAVPAHHRAALGAAGTSRAPHSPPPPQPDLRSLPFPVPLPRRGPSPAGAAASSAPLGIPEWPAPQPAAARAHARRQHGGRAAAQASFVSAMGNDRALAAPSRAGSSHRELDGAAEIAGEVPNGHARPARHGGTETRGQDHGSFGRAQSLPSSAAAIAGPAEEGEPDVVGPPLAARSSRRSVGSTGAVGEGPRRRRRGVDSAVGAIVEAGDGDEGDGEEVDESGMFQTSFHGHSNRAGCKEACPLTAPPPLPAAPVALMGSRSQCVVSGSDDGHIFVWERGTGVLVNLLRSSSGAGVSCVAPHPHMPMLASCGHEPVVRLWSPEAQEMADMEKAKATLRRSAAELNERQAATAGPPPLWLNMIAPPVLAAELEQRPRSPRGHAADRGDNPIRCSLM